MKFLVVALIALVAVPPTRMELRIVESTLADMPSDLLMRLPYVLVPPPGSFVPELLLIIVAALIVLRCGLGGRVLWEDPVLSILLLCFLAYILFDARVITDRGVPATRWLREAIPLLAMALFWPLAVWCSRSLKNAEFAMRVFFGLSCVYLVHSLYTGLASGTHIRLTHRTPYNTFPFAALSLAGLFTHALVRGGAVLHRRWLIFLLMGAAIAVLILLQTRGGILAAAVAVAWATIVIVRARSARQHQRTFVELRRTLLAIAVAVPVLFAYLGAGFVSRYTTRNAIVTQEWRMLEIAAALEKFFQYPVFGGGLGSEFTVIEFGAVVGWVYVHSGVFYYLANLGVIGFSLWLLVWTGIGRRLLTGPGRLPHRELRLFLISGSSLIVLFFFALVGSTYRTYQNGVAVALCLAALHAALAPTRRRLQARRATVRSSSSAPLPIGSASEP